MGFSRQEYWSGLSSPSPGDLPNPGIKLSSTTLQANSLLSESPGNPNMIITQIIFLTCLEVVTCLFKFYAKYIMQNAGLDESQAGIKTAGRNSNNLRSGDHTTLMAESKEELNCLLMKSKEESEKVGLKLNIQKTKIMASGSITS